MRCPITIDSIDSYKVAADWYEEQGDKRAAVLRKLAKSVSTFYERMTDFPWWQMQGVEFEVKGRVFKFGDLYSTTEYPTATRGWRVGIPGVREPELIVRPLNLFIIGHDREMAHVIALGEGTPKGRRADLYAVDSLKTRTRRQWSIDRYSKNINQIRWVGLDKGWDLIKQAQLASSFQMGELVQYERGVSWRAICAGKVTSHTDHRRGVLLFPLDTSGAMQGSRSASPYLLSRIKASNQENAPTP